MTLNDGMWRKVRGSNPQGLIQPRRFSRAVQSPICLTFHAASCGNDSRKLRKPQEISFVKQCCKATCAGVQVLGESQENQGEAWFSFPQLGRFCALASLQPRCVVVGLRKRFYAGALGKRQHRDGQNNRQHRSHSGPQAHRPGKRNLPPHPIKTSPAASVTGLLLDFDGAYASVGVGVHINRLEFICQSNARNCATLRLQ